jgi:hypothetical protein
MLLCYYTEKKHMHFSVIILYEMLIWAEIHMNWKNIYGEMESKQDDQVLGWSCQIKQCFEVYIWTILICIKKKTCFKELIQQKIL